MITFISLYGVELSTVTSSSFDKCYTVLHISFNFELYSLSTLAIVPIVIFTDTVQVTYLRYMYHYLSVNTSDVPLFQCCITLPIPD